MIHDRLQQIASFIDKQKQTSYGEIANHLGMKERQVRYDIERMNDILVDLHTTLIEKLPKGSLSYTGSTSLKTYFDYDVNIYTAMQRIDFIVLHALFDIEHLNLKKLSEEFKVSRSSIKKDILHVNERLQQYHCGLVYEKKFLIVGEHNQCSTCMVDEFTKYIYMYGRSRSQYNAYETYAMKILAQGFLHRDLKKLITWIKEVLEKSDIIMSDVNFRWYIASVCVYVWRILHHKEENVVRVEEQKILPIKADWKTMEDIIGVTLSDSNRLHILNYISYISKHVLPSKEDKHHCDEIVGKLISSVSYQLQFDFGNDDILYEGLSKHMQSLLMRLKDHIIIEEKDLPLLNQNENKTYEVIKQCVFEIEELSSIKNESEITYITMHFIAGLKRRDSAENKRILLVSGLGNAMQKLIEETLQSEFQLEIIDTIPSYKLATYAFQDGVDIVLSVMNVEIECPYPLVFIHPFLEEDYQKMSEVGIRRKKILPNLFGIYSRLNFLNKEEQNKVINIMQQELGLRTVRFYKNLHSLRDILRISDIRVYHDKKEECEVFDLHGIVKDLTKLHLVKYKVQWGNQTFYLHNNKVKDQVSVTKMFLSVTCERDVHICLLSPESMEGMVAYQELYSLICKSDFLARITYASSAQDIYATLLYCEHRI